MKSLGTLEFIQPKSVEQSAQFVCKKITDQLNKGGEVLWLLSGGSAINLAVETAKLLQNHHGIDKLRVTLADERWGKPGHADSNWEQLQKAGFKLSRAVLQPVLKGGNLEQTRLDYTEFLTKDLEETDYKLAIAGIGPDGHTLGIKPGSPAINARELVSAFEWDDYVRLTPTADFIKHLDEVIVYAFGAEKHIQLDNLEKDLPIRDQPAQALKLVKRVCVLNDYKGEVL